MVIIKSEDDCLISADFICQLGNETFYAKLREYVYTCVWVCVCFLSAGQKLSAEHVGVSVFPKQNDYLDAVKNE